MARPRKGQEKNVPIHLGFRVAEWVRDGLQRLAAKRGSPVSDIVNEALVAYLKRHDVTAPASRRRTVTRT